MDDSDVTYIPDDQEESFIDTDPEKMDRMPSYSPINFYQDAQDPLEGFSQVFPPLPEASKSFQKCEHKNKRKVKSKQDIKKSKIITKTARRETSFVLNREPTKGIRLIKIKVLDLQHLSDSDSGESDNDSNVLFSAQYVVKDICDEVMDQTERVINIISKKICGNNYL